MREILGFQKFQDQLWVRYHSNIHCEPNLLNGFLLLSLKELSKNVYSQFT